MAFSPERPFTQRSSRLKPSDGNSPPLNLTVQAGSRKTDLEVFERRESGRSANGIRLGRIPFLR